MDFLVYVCVCLGRLIQCVVIVSPVSFFRVIILSKCPSCGKGTMYCSLLSLKERCDVCDFLLKELDLADGPAFFAIFVVGAFVAIMAVVAEVRYMWPLWKHVAIWVPVTLALTLLLLRFSKSFLIAMHYRYVVLGSNKDK